MAEKREAYLIFAKNFPRVFQATGEPNLCFLSHVKQATLQVFPSIAGFGPCLRRDTVKHQNPCKQLMGTSLTDSQLVEMERAIILAGPLGRIVSSNMFFRILHPRVLLSYLRGNAS